MWGISKNFQSGYGGDRQSWYGKENELIVAIEEASNGDAVKNTSRENKVIMMSNTNKFVALEDISKEN